MHAPPTNEVEFSYDDDVNNALNVLAQKLALNLVTSSFPEIEINDAAKTILDDAFDKGQIEASRNILIVGAGASTNVNSHIPLAKDAVKLIERAFDAKYPKEVNSLIKKELQELTTVSRLDQNDFETQLLAYSRFDKDFVLQILKELYHLRYPVSLFYEIVAHMFKHRFIDVIVNFNFDEMLDNAIEEEMLLSEYKFIYSDGHCPEKDAENEELLLSGSRLRVPVYIKPHGTISHMSTLRFTRKDYYEVPIRMRETLEFLFKGERENTSPLPINLIVVGFGLKSFELNKIFKDTINKQNESKGVNINKMFYFDRFEKADITSRINRLPPELNGFTKDNVYFLPLSTDKSAPENLDNLFYTLWGRIEKQFKNDFKPKGIARHVILHHLFNPIAKRLLLTPFPERKSTDVLRQKTHEEEYFKDRIYVELGFEILNSNDGIINLHQLSQNRVGKYFLLLRNSDKSANLFDFLKEVGLEKYTPFTDDTWYFDIHKEKSTNLKSRIRTEVLKLISDDLPIKRIRTQPKHLLPENGLKQFENAIRRLEDDRGLYLTISTDAKNSRLSIFQKLGHENYINNDAKWIYVFRRFFTPNKLKKWDAALVISETGNSFTHDCLKDKLKNKKVLLIAAYNARTGKEERHKELVDKLKAIEESIPDGKTSKDIRFLPLRSHNQHMVVFIKVDQEKNKIIPYGGIYYTRRSMSKRVNPLLITAKEDVKRLLNVFYNYWAIAEKEGESKESDNNAQNDMKRFTENIRREIMSLCSNRVDANNASPTVNGQDS